MVNTDEWAGYDHLPELDRGRATVCHVPGRREWARDDDGDGVREVHNNTLEGFWTGLRNFLRPFRGVNKCLLCQYVAMFEWSYNIKEVTMEFLRALWESSPFPILAHEPKILAKLEIFSLTLCKMWCSIGESRIPCPSRASRPASAPGREPRTVHRSHRNGPSPANGSESPRRVAAFLPISGPTTPAAPRGMIGTTRTIGSARSRKAATRCNEARFGRGAGGGTRRLGPAAVVSVPKGGLNRDDWPASAANGSGCLRGGPRKSIKRSRFLRGRTEKCGSRAPSRSNEATITGKDGAAPFGRRLPIGLTAWIGCAGRDGGTPGLPGLARLAGGDRPRRGDPLARVLVNGPIVL